MYKGISHMMEWSDSWIWMFGIMFARVLFFVALVLVVYFLARQMISKHTESRMATNKKIDEVLEELKKLNQDKNNK